MDIVVLGGTGSLGRHVVAEAAGRGHDVRSVSRHEKPGLPSNARHVGFDLGTLAKGSARAQLGRVLDGAESVIDTVNGGKGVLVDGMRVLLGEEKARGVRHHLAISIVGCDVVPMGYYRTKVKQEQVVEAGGVPWSIQRATQFHTLVATALRAAGKAGIRPTGSLPLQPCDPAAVAARMVDAAEAGPGGRLPDVGGPRIQSLHELSLAWARHTGARRLPVRLGIPGKVGAAIKAGGLCVDGDGGRIGVDFATWLIRSGAR